MQTVQKEKTILPVQNEKNPGRKLCLELLENYGTPGHVVNHCIAVTETALRIAKALNAMGNSLDLSMLESAALLHDVARAEDDHSLRGAEFVESLGYCEIADLIRSHMTYSTDPKKIEISELDILCLADRMVKENTYVGIEERMDYILEKCKNDPVATERIKLRRDEIRQLCQRIESLIGVSMDELMT